jgi:hypothetical protein
MQAKQIDKLQNSIGHYKIYLPAINNLSIIFIAIKPQVAFAKIRFVVCTESKHEHPNSMVDLHVKNATIGRDAHTYCQTWCN